MLLLEDQPDHAEILREALETGLPGVGVHCAAGPPDGSVRPDVLLCSLSIDLDTARRWLATGTPEGDRPQVVLLSGACDRWTPDDLEGAAFALDKRDGAFLRRLPETVMLAFSRATDAAPGGAAPAAPRTPEPPRTASPVAVPLTGPRSETDEEHRATTAVAGMLAEDIERLLARMGSLAGLLRGRFPTDAPLQHYVAGLEVEVGRAATVARRLRDVAAPGGRPRRRRIAARDLAALRAPGWKAIVPKGIDFSVHVGDGAPDVEIVPAIAGRVLDDLVSSLLLAAPVPSCLTVDIAPIVADVGSSATLPGLRNGRYLRIAGLVKTRPAADDAHERIDVGQPLGHRLSRALAGVKAQGGYLDLTRDRVADALRGFAVLLPASPSVAALPTAGRTVLIVDDDDKIRAVAAEMLAADGFVVRGVSSGEDAVALYRAGQRYDVVLLDFSMAGMDGQQTFRELRTLDADITAVIVSGSIGGSALREMLSDGLLGYLPKPFGMRQLLETVHAAMA